jgi:hypothetical protein
MYRPKHGRREGGVAVFSKVFVAVALMSAFAMTSAWAASPHFKRGGEPVCTVTTSANSASVSCTGKLAGLGNDDLLITVTVSGSAVYQCQNAGGNTAPGQNRVLIGPAVAPTFIDADAIKNGNLTFTTNPAVLTAPATVSGAAAGCPNPNWTGVNPTLTVTDISLVIEQPPGTVIFSCGATDPASGTVSLAC